MSSKSVELSDITNGGMHAQWLWPRRCRQLEVCAEQPIVWLKEFDQSQTCVGAHRLSRRCGFSRSAGLFDESDLRRRIWGGIRRIDIGIGVGVGVGDGVGSGSAVRAKSDVIFVADDIG